MNDPLLVFGILMVVVGAFVLSFSDLRPEQVRMENRRARNLLHRARRAGLRGRYKFSSDRSKWNSTGEFATYQAADGEDRALYAAIGSSLEAESEAFSREMLWTAARLAWVGVPALVLGIAVCVLSIVG
ncbi:MAG TPA: hypothetical protein VEH57_02135 [Thermoplasmata archaeon]|nr:hypothetical protein [Thermoplasmata archaeon]